VQSVRELAAAHYSPQQIQTWAPADGPSERWRQLVRSGRTRVAAADGRSAGFLTLEAPDYVNLCYVHPDFARQGVASRLYEDAERHVRNRGTRRLWTHARLVAEPFFAAKGFRQLRTNRVERDGVELIHVVMEKCC
jgi:GNAT superfamily N-acetyltransferase